MHRRNPSRASSGPTPATTQMEQSRMSGPSIGQERQVQAAMMKPPSSGLKPGTLPSTGSTSAFLLPAQSGGHSVSAKYYLTPDPSKWDANVYDNVPEPDDPLHNPDPRRDHRNDGGSSLLTVRGAANLGCLAILVLIFIILFGIYPLVDNLQHHTTTLGAYNLGGINASGQVPEIPGNHGLIDKDTPESALTHISLEDGSEWDLVFSDEFNTEGRSFYPGDDPYWEAVDLHYWGTNNLEWYSPDMITTSNGFLNVTLDKHQWRGKDYKGGMMSSWNKFCFTGGYFVANVSLPGTSKIFGLWPAVWAMGNLGRAGYGASTDGTWPYTYDSCDVGTLPNQTLPDGTPINATINGDPYNDNKLSYLPGQRLSACTCKGESHPGPVRSDGSFVGRAAPEIDILEAQVQEHNLIGYVSQSGQWAPFNYHYEWLNASKNYKLLDDNTSVNTYVGGVLQQTTSGLSVTNQDCYTQGGGCFAVYGFEYKPGYDGYIAWTNDNKPAWKIYGAGLAADPRVEIGARPVPMEPMYMIINLGISPNFGAIDWEHLKFPTWMLVDWVRVYQPKNNHNIGCDPPDFPTAEYINTYIEAYTNPNLTTWVDDYGQVFPKNRLVDQCN